MSINWYPGHMAKATREIREILPKVDVIIEIVDARIPYSSSNPVIEQFKKEKPYLILFSKSDLADPEITQLWINEFNQQASTEAMATRRDHPADIRKIFNKITTLCPVKANSPKAIQALITGIPNVGKSSIINVLADRKLAKTGNEPAVTKTQQRIKLENNIVLYDTPGILWPKIENPNSGFRLACTGAIKNTAMDEAEAAHFLAEYLIETYPQLLKQRYQLEELPEMAYDFMEVIAKKRGKIQSGGRADMNEISRLFLTEFASGMLGNISLETPEMMNKEQVLVEEERKRREEKKANRKRKGREKGSSL